MSSTVSFQSVQKSMTPDEWLQVVVPKLDAMFTALGEVETFPQFYFRLQHVEDPHREALLAHVSPLWSACHYNETSFSVTISHKRKKDKQEIPSEAKTIQRASAIPPRKASPMYDVYIQDLYSIQAFDRTTEQPGSQISGLDRALSKQVQIGDFVYFVTEQHELMIVGRGRKNVPGMAVGFSTIVMDGNGASCTGSNMGINPNDYILMDQTVKYVQVKASTLEIKDFLPFVPTEEDFILQRVA